jgi:hypothetical protein
MRDAKTNRREKKTKAALSLPPAIREIRSLQTEKEKGRLFVCVLCSLKLVGLFLNLGRMERALWGVAQRLNII